jgi:hypothetical protein
MNKIAQDKVTFGTTILAMLALSHFQLVLMVFNIA